MGLLICSVAMNVYAADPVNVDSLLNIVDNSLDTNMVLASHKLGNHFAKSNPDLSLIHI